jgi:hypothetical protein
VCDPLDVDEDCNGKADDDDPDTDPESMSVFYADTDGDGWGATNAPPRATVGRTRATSPATATTSTPT